MDIFNLREFPLVFEFRSGRAFQIYVEEGADVVVCYSNLAAIINAESPKVSEVPKAAEPIAIVEILPPVVAEIPKEQPPVVKHETPRDLGRGGTQHQAIQKRIKEAAEELGFRSVIEKPVLDGQGSVDLWIERTGQAIACEISISTTIDHEVGNVAKCLKAGVTKVAMICLDEERLNGGRGGCRNSRAGCYDPPARCGVLFPGCSPG